MVPGPPLVKRQRTIANRGWFCYNGARLRGGSLLYDIAICDDDVAFAASFREQLCQALDARGMEYQVQVFSDPDELRSAIEGGVRFGLLFLDVLFAQTERGITLAASLRQAGCEADVVFMSTSPEFAAASFDVAPLHYLVKPVSEEKLCAALDRFLERNTPYLLRFGTDRGQLQVHLAEVTFFEIFAREIVIHRANGTKESCAGSLKELEEHLPAHTFVRPHRSYLVNLEHITEVARYRIRVSTGETIPVSQKLYAQVQQAIIDHADRQTVSL